MTTVSTRTGSGRERTSLRSALFAHARASDLVPLAAVPVVLLAVFTLPEATRRSLAFTYTEPTLLTAFTAHYVHLRIEHLAGNLVAYVLLAGIGYLLATAGRQRRLFFTAFATFCLVFPVALSALNLAVPRNAVGFGFSGVNMAFAGLLPLLLAAFAREHLPASRSDQDSIVVASLSDSVPVRVLPPVFLVSVGWMGTLAVPTGLNVAGAAGPAVALVGGGWLLWTVTSVAPGGLRSLAWVPRRLIGTPGYGDLFVVGVVLVVAYPVAGFPADPTGDGRVLNLYVHLLGYALAFIGPYVLIAFGAFDDPEGESRDVAGSRDAA